MKVLKEDGKGDAVELCLELSIGRRSSGKIGDDSKCGLWNNEGKNGDGARLDFSCGFGELEAQKFRSRLEDRENRERDGFEEELVRKRDKNAGKGVSAERGGLSLSLLGGNGNGMEGLYPMVQHVDARNEDNALRKNLINSSELELGSLERSFSAASDYQSSTQKGGSGSDAGSHSSHSPSGQPNRTKPYHHPVKLPATSSLPKPRQHKDDKRSNNTCAIMSSPDSKPPSKKETRSAPVDKPPKPPNHTNGYGNIPSTHRMPCVTTTGNGPNGKTVAGFLYKYTNAEVVIMCVCHGGFFTPSEFVEHAGGINVSHPLRQITVVPSPPYLYG